MGWWLWWAVAVAASDDATGQPKCAERGENIYLTGRTGFGWGGNTMQRATDNGRGERKRGEWGGEADNERVRE